MTKNNKTLQLFGGGWTEEKLAILRDYLHAYNTALKNKPFTRIYVDAFAGTGYRAQRQTQFQVPDLFDEASDCESQELLKGSTKLALEAEPSFHRFVFVETDKAKIKELEALKAQHPDKADQIDIIRADANEFLQDYCAKRDWRRHRAVLFLDPFATEVVWTTVEAVARTRAMDVWILFPLMAVNRLLAKDARKSFRKRLDAIFGTPEWFERFYRTTRDEDIFGQPLETVRKACDFKGIGDFYAERLRKAFAGVAAESLVWDNSRGSPLFQFFFAAGNEKGAPIAVRIADYILSKKGRKWA
jgi:three-Cys-motif partner protein